MHQQIKNMTTEVGYGEPDVPKEIVEEYAEANRTEAFANEHAMEMRRRLDHTRTQIEGHERSLSALRLVAASLEAAVEPFDQAIASPGDASWSEGRG